MSSIEGSRLLWTARILAIAYILFISLFALDIPAGMPLLKTAGAFLIHLVPSLVILGVLIIYWNQSFYSAVAFAVLCAAFTLFFNTYTSVMSFSILSLPILAVAVLFMISYLITKKQGRKSNGLLPDGQTPFEEE